MKLAVVGTGYVGLVTGACFAEKGHEVTCVDLDSQRVQQINEGQPPIYEPGLAELIRRHVGKRLVATTNLRDAIHKTDVSLIAVGTPFDGENIDLEHVKRAAVEIGQALCDRDSYHVVAVKSTVVPGTTNDVVRRLLEQASGKLVGKDFGLGVNPEFLREGDAVRDFLEPDRIVLGVSDPRSLEVLEAVYAPFAGVEMVRVNTRTAEMIKYAANALFAAMISFANEIGNLCSATGDIDVVDVMKGVHLDKRLSPILPDRQRLVPAFTTYLQAGCGFGGSCFPKDVEALVAHGRHRGQPMELLEAVLQVNRRQPHKVISLLERHFRSLRNIRVAVLGLAFKPDTDDMRESPAIPIIHRLQSDGALITTYDPAANHNARKIFGHDHINYCDSLEEAIADAQVLLVLTRWPEFARIPELLAHLNPPPLLIDGRRMLDRSRIARYEGIGIAASAPSGE